MNKIFLGVCSEFVWSGLDSLLIGATLDNTTWNVFGSRNVLLLSIVATIDFRMWLCRRWKKSSLNVSNDCDKYQKFTKVLLAHCIDESAPAIDLNVCLCLTIPFIHSHLFPMLVNV